MKSYVGLLIVTAISLISILPFDMKTEDMKDSFLPIIALLLPGITFSLFVLILQYNKLNKFRFILSFILLIVVYVINFYIGLSSWGIAVPIAGGIGSLMIKYILNPKSKLIDEVGKRFFGLGLASSFIGLLFYYGTRDSLNDGAGFCAIIISWQLVVGIEYIVQLKIKNEKTTTNIVL